MTPFGPEDVEIEWSEDDVEIVTIEVFLIMVSSREIRRAVSWRFLRNVPSVKPSR